MSDDNIYNWGDAADVIKDAIIRSRYQAATLVNRELLSLYYAVGRYVSQNSRNSVWGQGAIKQISNDLQKGLPGLRGFGEVSLKKMRLFYEAWQPVFINRQLSTDDLQEIRHSADDEIQIIPNFENDIDLGLLSKHIGSFDSPEFFVTSFYKVGFTHHSEILAKEKSLDGRIFYVSQCASAFWTVEALKSHLRGELYQSGRIPNNFLLTLPEQEQARRAIRSFKDEYFLDYINIVLDEYVKLESEAPSIGILLCKEANRNIVEFAVRDYTKPLGVATYRTRNEMPDKWKNALPDVEDMRKLLEAASDEPDTEVSE